MALPGEMTLPEQVALKYVRERPMTDAEVEATLGRLLFHLGRDDEAMARLNAAISLDPGSAEAHMTIGLSHLRRGDATQAIGPLRHANARDPGNRMIAYNYALATLQANDEGAAAPLEEAYSAMERLVDRDGPPEPLAVLGTIAGRLGRLEEARGLLRRAADLRPGDFPTEIELANVLLRVGEFEGARQILRRLASRAEGDQVQAVAQRTRWLGMAEARAALREELAAAAGLGAAAPDPGLRESATFPRPPELRTVRAGERRAAGLLDAVDCVAAGIVARVTTKSGALSLSAGGFREVDIRSNRGDVGGVITCGPRQSREAVYVTWSAGLRLEAIEFLPLDYQPDLRLSQRRMNVAATTASVTGQYIMASTAVAIDTPALPWAISRRANEGSGLSLTR